MGSNETGSMDLPSRREALQIAAAGAAGFVLGLGPQAEAQAASSQDTGPGPKIKVANKKYARLYSKRAKNFLQDADWVKEPGPPHLAEGRRESPALDGLCARRKTRLGRGAAQGRRICAEAGLGLLGHPGFHRALAGDDQHPSPGHGDP